MARVSRGVALGRCAGAVVKVVPPLELALSALAAARVIFPAPEKIRTVLAPEPMDPRTCGRSVWLTRADLKVEATVPVFDSATMLALAVAGTSRRASPETVCTRSAAGTPFTSTAPLVVKIAACVLAGIRSRRFTCDARAAPAGTRTETKLAVE